VAWAKWGTCSKYIIPCWWWEIEKKQSSLRSNFREIKLTIECKMSENIDEIPYTKCIQSLELILVVTTLWQESECILFHFWRSWFDTILLLHYCLVLLLIHSQPEEKSVQCCTWWPLYNANLCMDLRGCGLLSLGGNKNHCIQMRMKEKHCAVGYDLTFFE